MLDDRVGETFVKKGSPGRPETAYSHNRYVNRCGWRR